MEDVNLWRQNCTGFNNPDILVMDLEHHQAKDMASSTDGFCNALNNLDNR